MRTVSESAALPPPELPLTPKGLTLASSPQLFPFSHIHPTGPAGPGAASDNQSTHPRGDASLTSLTQTHADLLPKGAGIRAEAGSPRRPGRGHATIFAHAQQELPSQHKGRASGARGSVALPGGGSSRRRSLGALGKFHLAVAQFQGLLTWELIMFKRLQRVKLISYKLECHSGRWTCGNTSKYEGT